MRRHRAALLAGMSGIGFLNTAMGAAAASVATLVLGPADRGVMVIGLTICGVVALACSLGTGAGLRSLLPGAATDERRLLIAAYQWFSVAAFGIAGAAAVGAAVISAPAIDPGLADPLFLVGVGMFAIAGVMIQQMTDLWFADGRFRAGGVASLLVTTGGFAGMAVGIAVERSASILLVGQAAGMLLASIGQLGALARAGLVVVARPDRRDLTVLIRRGAPALGLAGGLAIALRADRYILGLNVGPAAVGVYSLAATLAEIARIIPLVVGQIFLRDTAFGHGAARLARAMRVAVPGALVTGGAVLLASWALLVPVFGPGFADARGLLVVLIVAELCFAPFFVASRGLVGGGWTTAAGVLGTVGGLVSIGAYFAATGTFAAAGAAAASVVVYAALSLASVLLLRTRLASTPASGLAADRVDALARRRVVHVFGAMDRGGAELRTVEAVEYLGRTEFDTVYVTLSGREGELAERIRAFGDRVIPILLDVRFPLRFVRFLRANRTDVVHSHVATFSGATLTLAMLAGVRRRIAHFRSDGDQHDDTPARRGQRVIMKALLSRSATDIVGVSPGSLDHGWRPQWQADPRCRVIANGLDVHDLPAVDDRRAMREELDIAGETRVICHVGRPAVAKNRQRAVDLACHPAVARAAAMLLVVGSLEDGEAERWRTRARARGREDAVRFLGTRTDVLRVLNAADLTLVTSTREGLPGVVLESLAVGTPVVASNLPGTQWIADNVSGVRVEGLDEPDEIWVRSIVSCLAATGSTYQRARLRASFAEGRFLLETNATELGALWRR